MYVDKCLSTDNVGMLLAGSDLHPSELEIQKAELVPVEVIYKLKG